MKNRFFISIVFFLESGLMMAVPPVIMSFGSFGKVSIYQPAAVPEAFVIFISGDGGWNEGVVYMAQSLVDQGAMVVGIDIRQYDKNIKSQNVSCYYPAGDFEELSLTIQKKYKFTQYLKPILIGYSSGATLVYGVLAQAPANTFKGAVSLGFCPDIEINKPLCKGSGLEYHAIKPGFSYYLESCKKLSAPFIVLEGTIDQVCNYEDTKKFMDGMPMSELVALDHVGHGFGIAKNWLPQFLAAYQSVLKEPGYVEKINAKNALLQPQHPEPLNSDIPLTLIPAAANDNLPLVFFISGDGGWTSFDQSVCEKLSEKGMPVIGLDAQKYFWNEKNPKETANDVIKAINYYFRQWNKGSFVLVGYSFGACAVPFIADNFPDEVRENLKGVYCISPDETGDFEIHIADMLDYNTNESYNVPDELVKIKNLHPVCIFGDEEDQDVCDHFILKGIKVETLPGSHHYNNDYSSLADLIYNDLIHKNLSR